MKRVPEVKSVLCCVPFSINLFVKVKGEKGVPEVKSVRQDQRAIKEPLVRRELMARKDQWAPQGSKEIWVSKDLLDPLAKQGLEVILVKEDLKAIKESRVQWDFKDPRAKRDLLEPLAERDLLDLRAKKDP